LDEYSYRSHKKAINAWRENLLNRHIAPIEITTRETQYIVEVDETIRWDISLDSLAKLPARFKKGGVVTAGNSCPMSDGASAILMMSNDKMESCGYKPLGKFVDWAAVGVDPKIMGIGPAYAIDKLLKQQGMDIDDIDLFEINEAFAAQVISCAKEIGLNMDKLNIDGGAIALGHPLGATGGMLTIKILDQLNRTNKKYGVVAFCCGGGQGVAALFENPNTESNPAIRQE
jgi:acetyl-CoA C-acetyltransferase